MEDLPGGVHLAQTVEDPEGWIQACLLIARGNQGLLLDRDVNQEWRVEPNSATALRAIIEHGTWPADDD